MQSTVIDQPVGKNIGDYEIVRSLGHGALSAVYEARKGNVAFIVTTFLLPDTLSRQARTRFQTRFERECTLLTTLHHPSILPVQDFGEYVDLPYLVTPSVKGSSLKKLLRRKGRFTPQQVFELLKRIADGFGYAHQHGVVHGTLNPANILFGNSMQIAGFGLMRILTLHGIEARSPMPTFLLSVAGTPLGTPGYIAPEVIQGQPIDARTDVYALGVLLLELLSGSIPFNESTLSTTMYVQAPRLATLCPDLPPSLDAVIQKAVNPDPAKRIQSVSELAILFEKACGEMTAKAAVSMQKTLHDRDTTLPSTVNWAKEEDIFTTGKWQGISPVNVRPEETSASGTQKRPRVEKPVAKSNYDTTQDNDPFIWWSNMSASQVAAQQTPGTSPKTAPRLPATKKRAPVPKPGRRRVVAMLAGGGIVALGALGFGGVTLAHVLQNKPTATTGSTQQAKTQPTKAAPTKSTKATKTQPTKATQTNPPKGSTTQPAPPKHTGTVVGYTSLGVNSSQTFTNPKDGTGSILVHLPNGNFVAYNKACTHQGVTVYYDAMTQRLMCPAHGSIFDPANGANPVHGPATTPLQTVPIRVNGDGTITVG